MRLKTKTLLWIVFLCSIPTTIYSVSEGMPIILGITFPILFFLLAMRFTDDK